MKSSAKATGSRRCTVSSVTRPPASALTAARLPAPNAHERGRHSVLSCRMPSSAPRRSTVNVTGVPWGMVNAALARTWLSPCASAAVAKRAGDLQCVSSSPPASRPAGGWPRWRSAPVGLHGERAIIVIPRHVITELPEQPAGKDAGRPEQHEGRTEYDDALRAPGKEHHNARAFHRRTTGS